MAKPRGFPSYFRMRYLPFHHVHCEVARWGHYTLPRISYLLMVCMISRHCEKRSSSIAFFPIDVSTWSTCVNQATKGDETGTRTKHIKATAERQL